MTRLWGWVRGHRSAAASALTLVVVGALVATVAVVSTGYEAQRLDLDDGTVWVANGSRTAIGRANTDILQLNSAVRSTGGDLSISQNGRDVLLVDRSNATVGIVDPATAAVSESVPLPPNAPDVLLAGDRAVVVSGGTGELWQMAVGDLSSFSAESDPDLSLGADAVTDVAADGTLTVYSHDSGEVSRIDPSAFVVASSAKVSLPKGGDYQVASIGSHWAALDTTAGSLVVDGSKVDLSDLTAGGLALQRSSEGGDGVLVATSTGLLSVPFSGGDPETVVDGRAGLPVRPVVVGDCRYAAWAGGSAWSDCSSARAGVMPLESVPASARLTFDVNGSRVVLNDPSGGKSWAVQRSGQLIDNWNDLIVEDKQQEQQEQNTDEVPPELDPDQKPPVAVDDQLGARPGRASTLSVLLNDYDPNGDPIAIDDVTPLDEATGRLDVINDKQQLLLTLTEEASGTFSFQYTITDGRGGSATATVTITVRTPGENSPPMQVRSTKATVSSSGRVTTRVLGDWVDPDGDAFYLTSATGDGVSYKPDGAVVYQDAGLGDATVDVPLVVSDGQAEGRGSLSIAVTGAGNTPLTAASFTVSAYAGRQITIRPMSYVTGGSGVVKLNSVPAKSGATITPSYETGTFRFASDEVRTHNLEYTVTDGDQTATGTIRVDVQAPPDVNTPPITTPKTAFVKTLTSETLDVTATDKDPAGNVLLVTATSDVPVASGVRVEILEQRYLRITLTAPLDAGPVVFSYTVTNGLASAQGTVTVIEIPRPSTIQPPIATDDQVTVRVGDAIDIDVLANDEQPDGYDITLVPELTQNVPSDGGLLFVSGTKLRYLAPKSPGNFTASYSIQGPDGQRATAQVAIAVREVDAATNNPPVPETVTARVVAGETVRISIPLDGIDPDGDSVQLLGVGTNPEKGNVSNVGVDYLEYQAGNYQAGTDTFTYTVVDGIGARATGTIRVGISSRAEGSRNPIAVADDVTMRPGGTISVRVLDNDSDPDGGSLSVTKVEPNAPGITAKIVAGTIVRVTPPDKPGDYGLVYTVENARGGASSSYITVHVDPDAPLNYPVADDTVLDLRDILNKKTVDVDVLSNVFFADGDVSQLGLGVQPGYGSTASATPERKIRVQITNASQIIPFYVSHPDDSSVKAYAFIRVPGYDDALPQLDKTAKPLSVISGETLSIDLNRYVVSVGTNGVRLTDSGSVRATHSNGANLVKDSSTLEFTSADLYFGSASISFEVTDGTSADDPNGRKATLVLPIKVTPRDNQPPVFNGTSLDLEPGESRTVDLTRLTTYPYPDDLGELKFAVESASVPGFTYSVAGQQLTVTVDAGTPKGTSRTLAMGVSDATAQGQSGAVRLAVVASTRPLAQPVADKAVTKRGQTTQIDVLQNDQATNPFPGQPLKVVAIRGLNGGGVPPGVSITPSADNRTLSVSVASNAQPVDTNLQYQVQDVTGDPERAVWGNVTISVQDVPTAIPGQATRANSGGLQQGQVTLQFQPASANNSPITNYRVISASNGGYSFDCGTATVCPLGGLVEGKTYVFQVIATNAIGDGPAAGDSPALSADYIPAAPTGVSAVPTTGVSGSIDVAWAPVAMSKGSPVQAYIVEIAGQQPRRYAADQTRATIPGLADDTDYTLTVYATNAAQVRADGSEWQRSAAVMVRPAGPPASTGIPSVSRSGNTVTVDWSATFRANGKPIQNYYATSSASSNSASCSASGQFQDGGTTSKSTGTGTSTTFSVDSSSTYTYQVFAFNGQGCTASSPAQLTTPPATVDTATFSGADQSGDGTYDVRTTKLSAGGKEYGAFQYELRVGNNVLGSGSGAPGDYLQAANGAHYGQAMQARYKACDTVGGSPQCSESWSQWFTVSAVAVNLNVGNPTYVPDGSTPLTKGSWTFSATAAPAYSSRQASCGSADPADVKTGQNTCDWSFETGGSANLVIVVKANGADYKKTYSALLN
ncbi:Ig-like domain-containing protein [Frigoribacterium sp. 2-23]|uniref:Ig-like domain-containing protein n=1 Tax=Frigoribacterium sp. 2-23 TaxID=3415006 RepID=UPI003C7040FE